MIQGQGVLQGWERRLSEAGIWIEGAGSGEANLLPVFLFTNRPFSGAMKSRRLNQSDGVLNQS